MNYDISDEYDAKETSNFSTTQDKLDQIEKTDSNWMTKIENKFKNSLKTTRRLLWKTKKFISILLLCHI